MIGRGYESRDLAAGSSRNASPTNHPDHPSPPPFCLGSPPIPCILRLPPSSSCAPLDTPQHHPNQPSRILVPHSSLFIHPSCTPSLWHHHRARSPAAATTTFLYSPPRRHAGSTKRDCCYVALGDQQVSPSSSSSKTNTTTTTAILASRRRRRRPRFSACSLSYLHSRLSLLETSLRFWINRDFKWERYMHPCPAFFLHLMIFDN